MLTIREVASKLAFPELISDCVEHARSKGVGEFRSGRRQHPRMPFVHPVRYCLESMHSSTQSKPGFTLNISGEGMALSCQQALRIGTMLRVGLPLTNGQTIWVQGQVVYCEPEEQYYRAGIAFTGQDCHCPESAQD